MNRYRFRFFALSVILFIFAAFLNAGASDAGKFMMPDHAFIQYTGRIDFSNLKAPVMYWSGTSIKANFMGTSLDIMLDDSNGDNYYNVMLDGDTEHPVILDCVKGKNLYPVASGLKDTVHQVWIFRRTETFSGPTRFLGFLLDKGKTLALPPPRPPHKIEFYGNSITCGMGNEVPDQDEDENNAKRNNFLAYGAITARALDADYTCISKSGIGILISWFDMVMPDFYDRLDPDNPQSRWDFSGWTPDVVVVNLFQNDSWLINRLSPVPGEERITAAYKDFIGSLRQVYPDTYIICSLGSMDATKEGSPWPGYIEKAVSELKKEGDTKIDTCFFPFDGTYKHPRVRHHKAMAEQLTGFIKARLGW